MDGVVGDCGRLMLAVVRKLTNSSLDVQSRSHSSQAKHGMQNQKHGDHCVYLTVISWVKQTL